MVPTSSKIRPLHRDLEWSVVLVYWPFFKTWPFSTERAEMKIVACVWVITEHSLHYITLPPTVELQPLPHYCALLTRSQEVRRKHGGLYVLLRWSFMAGNNRLRSFRCISNILWMTTDNILFGRQIAEVSCISVALQEFIWCGCGILSLTWSSLFRNVNILVQ
jgi:hypothetical protein